MIDDGEECDGDDLGDHDDCEDVGLGGTDEPLGCTVECTYDYTHCSGCGDGVIEDPEECEEGNLGGQSCENLGYDGGELQCIGCMFDEGLCYECGDGEKNGPEECDAADLGGETCASNGYSGGPLACGDGCTFDFSGCSVCGNGIHEDGEQCDGYDIPLSCQDAGYFAGEMFCTNGCDLNDAECHNCGNGAVDVNDGEECDGNMSVSCEQLGWDDGVAECEFCLWDLELCCNWDGSPCDNEFDCCGDCACEGNACACP
jgi:hypothetical protein